jgi:uncharacterized membrane protein
MRFVLVLSLLIITLSLLVVACVYVYYRVDYCEHLALSVFMCNTTTTSKLIANDVEKIAETAVDVASDLINDIEEHLLPVVGSVETFYQAMSSYTTVTGDICLTVRHMCVFHTMWFDRWSIAMHQKDPSSYLQRNYPRCLCTDVCSPHSTSFLQPWCKPAL